MANKLIELLISAKDTTKGAFNSTLSRLELLKKKATALRGVGSVVGSLFAGYGALQSFKAIIAATREQEAALKQVEARLRSTGGASGETLESLQKMASGLQDVTTYGDEAILKMQSLLLTFTNIQGDTFKAATESILDMSVAMGQDLKTSALQVGKALNNPIEGMSALTRVGVKLTDQQKEQIRTLTELGRVSDAQAIILKELQVEFGGAAKAAADTFGGAIEQLNNAFADLLEAKGGLTSAKKEVQEFTKVLKDPKTKAAFEQATSSAVKLGAALSTGAAKGFNLFISAGEKLGVTLAQGALKLQGMSTEMAYYVENQDKLTESTKELIPEVESLADTVERLGKEADASRDLLAELGGVQVDNSDFSEGVDKVLEKLEEERYLLKLSAKEQFIYNQVKKAGTDATYEEINAIKKAAESLFNEKEAIKSAKEEAKKLNKEKKNYGDISKEISRDNSSSSVFGKEKEQAKELTEETEKATKAQREFLTASSQGGKDTSDAFNPINLTPEQGRQKIRELAAEMQDEANKNPVQMQVQVPTYKETQTTKSSFSDPLTGGGSGLSSVSIAKEALKKGTK